jgi:hypothetical protein
MVIRARIPSGSRKTAHLDSGSMGFLDGVFSLIVRIMDV